MTSEFPVQRSTVGTRREARELVSKAQENGVNVIDMEGVEFISRSVADELLYHRREAGIEISGATGEVKKMLDVVKKQTEMAAL